MQDFLCLLNSAPVRGEHESGVVAWIAGTLWHQVCRDTDCLSHRRCGPTRVSVSWWSEGHFGWFFSILPTVQALRGLPCLGSFSVVWYIRHIEGRPTDRGPTLSSMRQAFDGPASLSFSCQCWCVGSQRLWWWLHPLHMTQQCPLASMAARLSCTGISHYNLLPHIPSICLSEVNSSSTILKLQLPASAPSRGPVSLSGLCMAAPRTVWFSYHLGCHWSAVSLSTVNISPVTQTIAPTSIPVFPPSSFILPSFAWLYIFFSTGQILLSTLSWCSACTSVSEGVFLIYPWREMFSMSTYYSAILFSLYSWF